MHTWPDLNVIGEYWLDAWQRSVLFLDTLIYDEHNAKETPHVLHFESELVLDGRTLERPVNYGLVRIVPPSEHRSIHRRLQSS